MLAVSCLCDTQVDNLNHDEAEKFIATKTVGTLNASCNQSMVMMIDSGSGVKFVDGAVEENLHE